jgi:hypothetical protein
MPELQSMKRLLIKLIKQFMKYFSQKKEATHKMYPKDSKSKPETRIFVEGKYNEKVLNHGMQLECCLFLRLNITTTDVV